VFKELSYNEEMQNIHKVKKDVFEIHIFKQASADHRKEQMDGQFSPTKRVKLLNKP